MLLLANIVNALATRDVPLGPKLTVRVRALWAGELDAIAAHYVRPAAPYGKNPFAGSAAPPIQREDDVGYLGRVRQWFSDMTTAECAVAIDLGVPPGPGQEPCLFSACPAETQATWLAAAVAAMRAGFFEPQIRLIWNTTQQLGTKELVREAIKVFIVESKGDRAPDENQIEIPANYDTSETGLLMAAAGRFHVGDPFAWIDSLEPAKRAIIIADELIHRRRHEESMLILAQSARVAGLG